MARSRKTHIHAPATSEAQPEPSDGLRAGPGSRPVSGGVFSRRAALYSGLFIVRARGPVFGANTANDKEAGTRKGGRRPRAGAGGDPPRGGGGGKATKGARQKLTGLGAKRPPSLPTPPASARGAHPPASLHFIALYLWLFGRTVLAGALTRSVARAKRVSSCPGWGTDAERGPREARVFEGLSPRIGLSFYIASRSGAGAERLSYVAFPATDAERGPREARVFLHSLSLAEAVTLGEGVAVAASILLLLCVN